MTTNYYHFDNSLILSIYHNPDIKEFEGSKISFVYLGCRFHKRSFGTFTYNRCPDKYDYRWLFYTAGKGTKISKEEYDTIYEKYLNICIKPVINNNNLMDLSHDDYHHFTFL